MDAPIPENVGKRLIILDRDGTLIKEPQDNFQVDSLEKLEFLPGVFRNLSFISKNLSFEMIMVSNQDGLGSLNYPVEAFYRVQEKIIKNFANEGIHFLDVLIDTSLPSENKPTRKPGTALLSKYLNGEYNLKESWVIGDRYSDVQLARNLGARAILIKADGSFVEELPDAEDVRIVETWDQILPVLYLGERISSVRRKTGETDIYIYLDLDGNGKSDIHTGLGFFDHMLDQIARHAGLTLKISVKGDLNVDEHHTIEDTALALGDAFYKALGSKLGVERYGFALPMDDSRAKVLIDFGGRAWLQWNTSFKREKIGDMPTEMFFHFFKSFSDSARCNLAIDAEGENEHHKIEAIFKALAKAIKMAIRRDPWNASLPTTKGVL